MVLEKRKKVESLLRKEGKKGTSGRRNHLSKCVTVCVIYSGAKSDENRE